MNRLTLHRRNLSHYRRVNLAVILGVAVGTATLTGALLVGDSMRVSLRRIALGRLGRVDHALVTRHFVREELATQVAASAAFTDRFAQAVPVILLAGSAHHGDSGARVNHINLLAVDHRFALLGHRKLDFTPPEGSERSVILNEPLARELGAGPGDDVLIQVGKPSSISTETLLGRRDDTSTTLRLPVQAVVPADDIGAFSLNPRQVTPKNAFLPLSVLQKALDQQGRVNAILVTDKANQDEPSDVAVQTLQQIIDTHVTLGDLGITLRVDESHGYIALESASLIIEPEVERAALAGAAAVGCTVSPVLTYLANTIEKTTGVPGDRSAATARADHAIPYSTLSAIDPKSGIMRLLVPDESATNMTLKPGEILLNEWAADDLKAQPGDSITLSYFVTQSFGRLQSERTTFVLRGIVPLKGAAADPGFTPPYKGVTDADNLADWDPPFPMDLKIIRKQDEAYWDRFGATPKAFITLADGQRLWSSEGDRLGRLTSIRFAAGPNSTLTETAKALEHELLSRVDLEAMGLTCQPVRAQMIEASEGTTDFGMLFLSFSFFLILSSAMLVALLFRLGVEQRSAEIGLLLATGFAPRSVTRLLVVEGLLLATVGSLVGLAGSVGYAWLMLAGLRTWWSSAVHTPFLRLHVPLMTLLIGFVAGIAVATLSVAWSIRGLAKQQPRTLLSGGRMGEYEPLPDRKRSRLGLQLVSVSGFSLSAVMILLTMLTKAIPRTVAFFGGGAAMLVGCLTLLQLRLKTEQTDLIHRPGLTSGLRLGMRNARRHIGRSILTAGLIASATFLITSLEAFRMETGERSTCRQCGTGGFELFAQSAVPLVYDLNSPSGRDRLSLPPSASDLLKGTTIIPFRLRPGDASSCLNLYRPQEPRILGAPTAMIERGGFAFASTLAGLQARDDNPWDLLNHTFADGAIPVIGDEAAVLWQLHLGLGKDLVITNEGGQEIHLRFVALLSGSVLQDELVMAESAFKNVFPSISGYGFFLIDTPPGQAAAVQELLENELGAFGFDADKTGRRLSDYLAVQNTYLSTFQSLGGLGLILGTIGLAAVLLRNVWERRGELALLQALGFTRFALGFVVLAENVSLLVAGLLAGLLSALLAITPHIVARPDSIPWLSLGLTLAGVLLTGLLTGIAAVVSTLRAPLLPALRSE